MSLKILLILLTSLALAACASQPVQPTGGVFGTPGSSQVGAPQVAGGDVRGQTPSGPAQAPAARLQATLVPSELVVGANRFAVGLFDAKGEMIHDAAVHLQYYDLSAANTGSTPVVESEADAVLLQTPDGLTTIFAHERKFSHAGNWGVGNNGPASRWHIGHYADRVPGARRVSHLKDRKQNSRWHRYADGSRCGQRLQAPLFRDATQPGLLPNRPCPGYQERQADRPSLVDAGVLYQSVVWSSV